MGSKLDVLLNQLPDRLDGVMIQSELNRRYYTGFPSSAGTIIATRDKSWFIIDSRYIEAAKAVMTGYEILLQDKLYGQLSVLIKDNGIKTLGVEETSITLDGYGSLTEKLPDVTIPMDSGLSKLIDKQRSVKLEDEIECITSAQAIAEKTFDYILGVIKPGMTETDIMLDMEMYSRRNGSDEAAFPFIVASGPNSSMPHAVPGDRRIQKGDFIVMDFGCTMNGYRSDMTRTVAVGPISAKQREVYDLVLKAQAEALTVIKPGAICTEVDKVARDIIDGSPYKGCFGHGLGHSLGLAVHESPRFGTGDETVLEPGMVMSVEPGIYLPGEFGVRIEDLIVVTETGYKNFMKCSKGLVVL